MRKKVSMSPEKIREQLPPNLRELVDELVERRLRGDEEEDDEEDDLHKIANALPKSDIEDLAARGVIILDREISKVSLAKASARLLSLHFNPAFTDDIQIILNSPGGYMDAMWSFIDLMESNRCNIRTIAMGEICSAATMIFIAGDERIMAPNSVAMIHQFSTWTVGTYDDLVAARKGHDLEARRVAEHILRYSKYKSLKDVDKILLKNDNWLSPQEMKKHGLCDQVPPRRKR